MRKGGWLLGWAGVGVVIGLGLQGCGEQAIDYPAGSADGGGACRTNAECKGFCANGACAACTTPAQCQDPARPTCDTATGACVGGAGGCTSSAQCTGGQACVSGACTACTANNQCAAGLVCAAGACGPCTSSTQCDPGQSCTNGSCGGGGGDSGVTLPDGGLPGCNSGYVGVIGPIGPVWADLGAAAAGATGKLAGDNACAGAHGAGAHACTWEEVKASDACGKLNILKGTTDTAWMHRTAAETASAVNVVDDNPGLPPGPGQRGGRCNDWTYPTNHAWDGEYIEFGGGIMKGHLDSDTADDNGATSAHAAAGVIECAGMLRKILCCK